MELQMRAERERRAAVTQAEAGKRAAILEAEGVREAAVLRAQGMAEARLAMAQAEAETIGRIASALPAGEASEAAAYLLALRYFEALPAVAQGPATTLFLPAEASGVLGALGSLRSLLTSHDAGQPRSNRGPNSGTSNSGTRGGPQSASTAGPSLTGPSLRPPPALGSGQGNGGDAGGP
jgi:hypothetical protein